VKRARSQNTTPIEVLRESGIDREKWGDTPFYEGKGCIECSGSGHRGRTAISELLDLSDHIREMTIDRRPTSEIKTRGPRGRNDVSAGFRAEEGPLRDDLAQGNQ